MKHFAWFLVLALSFAFLTAGLTLWHERAFSLDGLWMFAERGPHPLYLLVIGLSVIPGALWEIFMLEYRRNRGDGGDG